MRSPLVTRKRAERDLNRVYAELNKTRAELTTATADAAAWRVQYRSIRDRIVDIATNPNATSQVKAVLVEFVGTTP